MSKLEDDIIKELEKVRNGKALPEIAENIVKIFAQYHLRQGKDD